jgi:hypothetical protein
MANGLFSIISNEVAHLQIAKTCFAGRAYEFFFINFITLLLSSMAILYFNCPIYVTQFEYRLSKSQDIYFTTSTGQCA